MGCLPQSGGCERELTDVVANQLNAREQSRYVYSVCLDVQNRSSKEPEALYIDETTQGQLVIEAKSLVWPPAYASSHANDHFLYNEIHAGLVDISLDRLYVLEPPSPVKANKKVLRQLAADIVSKVIKKGLWLEPGKEIRFNTQFGAGRFAVPTIDSRFDDWPEKGLVVQWKDRSPWPVQVPVSMLRPILERLFSEVIKKFAGYRNARRILALRPYGDLVWWSDVQWQELLRLVPPPPDIQEIWSVLDYSSEESIDWNVQKLYPVDTSSM